MDIDILIEDPRWRSLDIEPLATRAILATLEHLDIAGQPVELSLLACDDAQIATLNATFRDKPIPTNVLSWPAHDLSAQTDGGPPDTPTRDPDGTLPLGDIAIAYDTCTREATAQGKPLADHVTHLVVHGLLHLLGYDHTGDRDATLMEGIEAEILGKMGLDDPYRDP